MAASSQIQYTVTLPVADVSFFSELIKRNKWKLTPFTKAKAPKTLFEKSQEDIKSGRITTYKSTDDFFEKVLS
jgi:hypothetical protein